MSQAAFGFANIKVAEVPARAALGSGQGSQKGVNVDREWPCSG